MSVIFGDRDKKQKSNFEQQKQNLSRYWKNSRLITSEPVLKAFLAVPRELFVDHSYRDQSMLTTLSRLAVSRQFLSRLP